MNSKLDEFVVIPLDMFLKCNKIKELGVSLNDLCKAVSIFSKELEINEDKTHVKKKIPYKAPVDTDSRTVYVEGLPKNCDHDWVKKKLSVYGEVSYVSLPTYPSTKKPKGFAFVEFATERAALDCLNVVGTKEFSTVHPFPKAGSKDLQRMQKAVKNITASSIESDDLKTTSQGQSSVSDKASDDKTDNSETPAKKRKLDTSDPQNEKPESSTDAKPSKKRKQKRSLSKSDKEDCPAPPEKHLKESNAQHTQNIPDLTISVDNGSKNITAVTKKEKDKTEENSLRAISKHDWLTLKKRYLQIQKTNMATLKKQIRAQKEKDVYKETAPSLELIPGVVVKVIGASDITREFVKSRITGEIGVSYIDTQVASNTGYIRCKTASDAISLVKLSSRPEFELTLLQGEEESAYWVKLNQQRIEQRTKVKKKTNKKKGKKKVMEKQEKMMNAAVSKTQHIVFDD